MWPAYIVRVHVLPYTLTSLDAGHGGFMADEHLKLPRSHDSIFRPPPKALILPPREEPPTAPTQPPAIKLGRRPLHGQNFFDHAMLVATAAVDTANWKFTPPALDPVDPIAPLSSRPRCPRSQLLQPSAPHVPKKLLADVNIEVLRSTVRAFEETLCGEQAEGGGLSVSAPSAAEGEEQQHEEVIGADVANAVKCAEEGRNGGAAGLAILAPAEPPAAAEKEESSSAECLPSAASEHASRIASLKQELERDVLLMGKDSPFLLPITCGLGCALVKAGRLDEALEFGVQAADLIAGMGTRADPQLAWQADLSLDSLWHASSI